MLRLLFLFVLALQCVVHTSAVRFYLEPGEKRCFTEELPTNSKILGEASVATGKSEMTIDVWITTSEGRVLYHKRAPDHGKFKFMTPATNVGGHAPDPDMDDEDYDDDEDEDTYKICLEHQQIASRGHVAGTRRLVYFNLDHAFSEMDRNEKPASGSSADKLQATMRNMHTTLSGIVGDLSQLQKRERSLLSRTQKTSSRITMFAVISLFVTLGTSAFQYKYYKGYFKQKKLC